MLQLVRTGLAFSLCEAPPSKTVPGTEGGLLYVLQMEVMPVERIEVVRVTRNWWGSQVHFRRYRRRSIETSRVLRGPAVHW